MERLLAILAAIALHSGNVVCQDMDSVRNVRYGIELNQFITGSGFSTATELLLTVTEGSRSFNAGFFFCPESRRITGVIAHHEILLSGRHNFRKFQTYAFYNGIARITRLVILEIDGDEFHSAGIYKTFEHHLGFGVHAKISDNLYFSGSGGYGVYFGSVKKPVVINGTDEIAGTNGFAPVLKVGIGLNI